MSGLAALLAGHNKPNIYQWHSSFHVQDIEHAVEHAGWRFVYLDGWTIEDKASFLKATAAAFSFPDLGENFDALSESIGDVTAGDQQGIVMLWDGWGPLARADEQAFWKSLEVLGGRVRADDGRKFAVLLRGEGPEIDVPELEANPG